MRTKYTNAVNATATFDGPIPPTLGYTLNKQGPQPYYAKYSTEDYSRQETLRKESLFTMVDAVI